MRLLFTIPDFWPHVRRGSERLVHDLAVAMTARGHQVTILTTTPAARRELINSEGFTVDYRPRHQRLERALGLSRLEAFAITAGAHALRDPHDIHHAFYITDAYGMALASRVRPRPLVFSWHGVPGARWWDAHLPRTHRWYRRVMRRAARISVMTDQSAELYMRDYGRQPVVLTPGVFVDDFVTPRNGNSSLNPVIVCAAAIDDPRKRMDVLLSAFAIVHRERPGTRLLLVGHGSAAPVHDLIAGLPPGVAPAIELEHTVDLRSALGRATVGVLTSEVEAFGLVVLEYLAAGLPSVVSDDGGSAALVTSETGIVFRRGDPTDCARALLGALDLATIPATAGRCVDRAREFDWSTRVTAYEDLYDEVAHRV